MTPSSDTPGIGRIALSGLSDRGNGVTHGGWQRRRGRIKDGLTGVANQAFPVQPLEDPKGAFGQPESLHSLGRGGFSTDFPAIAKMIKNFKLDDAQYGTLEDTVVNTFGEGKEAEAVQAWLRQNPDYARVLQKDLTAG